MNKFQIALEEARKKADVGNAVRVEIKGATVARPVQINLSQDKVAANRVVRAAARRVIAKHRDEIEALAYK